MAPLWIVAGVLFAFSAAIVLLPWLRTVPGLAALPALPWQAGAVALLILLASGGLMHWSSHSTHDTESRVAADAPTAIQPNATTDSWNDIARDLGAAAGSGSGAAGNKPEAAPMSAAIASLQMRLAKGGGSADDWELLAKSYEFLGRPADAAKARQHRLPEDAAENAPATTPAAPAAAGTVIKGEVSLAPALQARASPGSTLFILAKALNSPGPPVAVLRTTAGSWPLKFELTDSQAMLPGRNLSSAGRVSVEARISQSGQPLAAAGDLQGTSGSIDPANAQPVRILIDKVVQ